MRENLRSYQGPVGPHRRDLVVTVGVKAGVNVETRNIMDLSPRLSPASFLSSLWESRGGANVETRSIMDLSPRLPRVFRDSVGYPPLERERTS